jgi:hypothetical protein
MANLQNHHKFDMVREALLPPEPRTPEQLWAAGFLASEALRYTDDESAALRLAQAALAREPAVRGVAAALQGGGLHTDRHIMQVDTDRGVIARFEPEDLNTTIIPYDQ